MHTLRSAKLVFVISLDRRVLLCLDSRNRGFGRNAASGSLAVSGP